MGLHRLRKNSTNSSSFEGYGLQPVRNTLRNQHGFSRRGMFFLDFTANSAFFRCLFSPMKMPAFPIACKTGPHAFD